MSIKVLFGPIRSCSVHIGLIWSTLILFCPFWSYSVHSVYFGIIWSYSVHIGPIWSILCICSTSVLFEPFGPHWSYSVHFVHFGSIRSILVLFGPLQSYSSLSVRIGPIRSILVLFGSFCPLWSYSVHTALLRSNLVFFGPLGPLQSIRSYSVHLVLFGPPYSYSVIFCPFGPSPFKLLQFILVYFNLFLCTYIMGRDMFGLKVSNLNPNLLKYI